MALDTRDQARSLGVDGGATHVRLWSLARDASGWRAEQQLARFAWPSREAAEAREHHGARCVVELADALAQAASGEPVALALCMPGRKTDDRRGIAESNHGPVAADFLGSLEHELAERGVRIARRPTRLFGDGHAATAGEFRGADGALVGVRNGYYLGAGTGLAEGLVLGREVIALDWIDAWFPKAWTLRAGSGETFEAELSGLGIARRAGPGPFVERRRAAGDRAALEVLDRAARALGELVACRVATLASSPLGAIALDRVVLGQHFVELVDARFLDVATRELRPPQPAFVVSRLPAAAALGAHLLEESDRS
ncbi:MAG: hypothetical protein K8S98_00025 [Planctomycetes bacterium]|nr:hypothetical protein [Planctomycetota bacterium]